MSAISAWSTTAANNTDLLPEGSNAGVVDNRFRDLQAEIRTWYETAQWVNLGYTHTYASATTFTISGDKTSDYHAGRRVKCVDSSTFYAYITASSYSAPNTTVTIDTSSLTGSLSQVWLSALTNTNHAIPMAGSNDNGATCYLSGDYTLTTGVSASVPWDADVYDTHNIHDTSSNKTRLTVPAFATKVRIYASILFSSNGSAGRRIVTVKKNGSSYSYGGVGTAVINTAATANGEQLSVTTPILTVTGGDYFEIELYQTSGSNVLITATNYYSWAMMEIIK